MTLQFPHIAIFPSGNTTSFVPFDTGGGYFLAYRTGSLVIECWGKGGKGVTIGGGIPPVSGGGGGGAGGYSKKTLSVTRGNVFQWTITGSSSTVSSSQYSLTMIANCGSAGAGTSGGAGGTASGGDINTTGQAGASTFFGGTGGKGGDAPNGGTGGNGGSSGHGDGFPGGAPGAGGGGAARSGGTGGAPGTARIKFSWP